MPDKIVKNIDKNPFKGEDGLDYLRITKEISTPRKTYLKGIISGKYRGRKIEDNSDESDLFDFDIYEAEVICNSKDDFRENKPFVFPNDFNIVNNQEKIKGTVFPKEKLPTTLPVVIKANEISFGINVLEPKLFEFEIVRKMHQIDGDEVFGTFNAFVTGYVLDYKKEIIEEIIGPIINELYTDHPSKATPLTFCECSNVETGRTEVKDNYFRKEYKCRNHDDNVWGQWQYRSIVDSSGVGCFSQILSTIAILIGLFFLIYFFPFLLIFVGYYFVLFLIGFLAPYFRWVFRILGVILLIAFVSAIINTFSNGSQSYNPSPLVVDSPRETTPVIEPIVDAAENSKNDTIQKPINDSILTRFRSWNDYSGNKYEGNYQIRLSDFNKAHQYKSNLNLNQTTINSYDKVVYDLKEFDKNKFNSLYNLFDSIGKANRLNKIRFAEMIVTFVQDIPYVLILDKGCDASLYDDSFVRKYLSNQPGKCEGFQQFGINTPVEFLTNLKGDCDTRTLLLYTIFSHYNYDVALMSSEFYGHSIIGLNLPIKGMAYTYDNQRYVLWETTAPNCKPGVISNEISNLNNWRISLKSK